MKTNKTNSIQPGSSGLKHLAIAVTLGLGLAAGTVLAAPANDDFANAIDLTGSGGGQTGSVTTGDQTGTNSVDATMEVGEPAIFTATKTVWFKWTSPGDGEFTFGTAGSTNAGATEWDSMIGIYTGASVDALTPLGTTPKDTVVPESMTVTVTPGTTYYIQLAGYEDEVAANILLTWNYVALVYQADIESFGPGATIGTVVSNAADIAWTVPFGSNLATLAPTFTLSLGATCEVDSSPVVSGDTVDFSGGPKDFVVTSQGATIVNTYTVTVTIGPEPLDGTWITDGDGNWSDIANWQDGIVAIGTGKTATFPNIITANRIVTLDGAFTIGNIAFADTTHNLTISGANPLTLDVTSGSTEVSVTGGAARALQISSDLVSSDPLSKTGNGILRLAAAAYNFPSISVAGGTLDFSSASNDTVNRTLGGGNYAGAIDIATGATFQFWRNSGTQEFSGVISGGGNVRLAHKGTYTLSGANTYTGKTTVHGEFNGNTATLNVSSFNSVVSGSIETGMGTVATPVASSSLGVPANATNGIVDIGRTAMQASAVLNYTGAGETTDRVMNLVASGNSQRKGVNNLGTGTLTFTSPWTGVAGVHNNTIPITTNADMVLAGSVPDHFVALEKRGSAKLSLSGPCTIWNNVNLYAGTLEVDSEINDGGVYSGAITTGSGNGGTNFIAVPAGTPLAVGMTIVHPRFTAGTTITAIVDINANPVVAQVSSNSDTTTRTETGYIGFKGALGIIPPAADKLRWFGNATLKYDGPNDSTNRNFTVDNGFTSTWEIITGSTLEVSGATTNTTGKITKTGAGTLVLSGNLLHDGINNVDAGTLLINGDSSGMTGAVNVNNTAILGGTGTIGGSVDVGSTAGVAPGASAGTLTIAGDLDISALAGLGGGTLDFELDDPLPATDSDQIAANTLTIGTDLLRFTDFTFSDLGNLANGTYVLVTTTSGITGSLNPTPANLTGAVGTGTGTLGINGNNLELVVTGIVGGNPFDTWAATGTLGPVTFGGDTNGDGVKDGIAFLLGVANPDDDANGNLPTVTESGGDLVMEFDCLATADRGTSVLELQYDGNLADTWPSVPVPGAVGAPNPIVETTATGSVSFVATANGDLIHIVATISDATESAGGKLFGRLEGNE